MPNPASRGPGRPPAAKSAETRGRILRAAREVFSEMGFDAATFQEIAVRADLTRPAINHHFPSKHVLYRHVVEQANSMVVEAGLREAESKSAFPDRVHAFLRAGIQANGYDRTAAAFLVTSVLESQRHPELTTEGSDALRRTRDFAFSAVRDGVASGELRADLDVDAAAELLLAALWGLGFYAGFVGDQRSLDAVTAEFIGLLGGGGWRNTV